MTKGSQGFLFLFLSIIFCAGHAQTISEGSTAPAVSTPVEVNSAKDQKNWVESFLSTLTPEEESALQEKLRLQKKIGSNPFGIILYEPTYVLPAYYTGSPDRAIYENNTPDNQKVYHLEFKAKISLLFPVYHYDDKVSFNISYTQVSLWQFYAKSQYFRETNYEPQVFFSYNFKKNWLIDMGINHESNGRGGDMERSWNRAFTTISFSGENYLIALKPWVLIFQADSSDLHNKDISDYFGYGSQLFVYRIRNQEFSAKFRNVLESNFARGATILTWSFPIKPNIRMYMEGFIGYGQSLIEYNHYTNSVGIGLALNDWI